MWTIDRSRPVHLLVNPHSGYGGNQSVLRELRRRLHQAGLPPEVYVTKAPGDATRHARSIADRAGVVLVWGGDGTVNEVVNGLSGTEVPILPCPAGTENLLAKEFGMPRQPRALVDVLRDGRCVHCDVGRMNDRNFLLILGVGFDAEVIRRVSARRRGHISHLSYFWPIWRTFWEHDFPRMRIVADGEEIYHDFGLAFVGNISRYAVGLRICRDARFDDGLLDLVVFQCHEQTSLLLHAAWTLLRIHPLKGNVLYRRFRRARIETEQPVPVQIDGDVGSTTPVNISVAPARVYLLIPPEAPGWIWPWNLEVPV